MTNKTGIIDGVGSHGKLISQRACWRPCEFDVHRHLTSEGRWLCIGWRVDFAPEPTVGARGCLYMSSMDTQGGTIVHIGRTRCCNAHFDLVPGMVE